MILEVVPEQAFCELQRTALTEFFTAYQIIFCLFWHLANSASFISYRCYYTTVDYQRKHLSQLKQQQFIVWTMIGLRKRFLEYNTNKIPHSTSAV